MNLGRKLARLTPPVGAKPAAISPPRLEKGLGEGRWSPSAEPVRAAEKRRTAWVTRSTPHGPIHLHEQHLAEDHHHGRARVANVLRAQPEMLAALALDPGLREVDPKNLLLLDTETTGLAGGTGTLAFVLGLGWFENGALKLAQLILPNPGEEAPMLRFLEERLAAASCVVTYNGKTFDWPLLRNRFVMNRLEVPTPRPHLDLLHCARRVYRHRPGGARLVHLEESVLGHKRIGDIPGEEIPERYFQFLRTRDAELIAPVIEHNAHDLVLLAALLGEMAEQFLLESADVPPDQLGYAQVASRGGDSRRAMSFAREAAKKGDAGVRISAYRLIADVSRRTGENLEAVRALEAALTLTRDPDLHLQLAKLYEHRVGNVERALFHARQAARAESPEDHLRRIQRLERRMEPTSLLPL